MAAVRIRDRTDEQPVPTGFPASGVAFDGPRHRAFVTDTQAREVVAVDLDTGLEIRRWTVPGLPERMSTTPDSRRLYVALPAAPHRYESTVPNGDVVEFDLEAMAMTRLIPVETDPWELAATDDGILVVSSGSNQFGPVDAYRLSDGVRTARMVTRFRLRTLLRSGPELRLGVDHGFQSTGLHPVGSDSQLVILCEGL